MPDARHADAMGVGYNVPSSLSRVHCSGYGGANGDAIRSKSLRRSSVFLPSKAIQESYTECATIPLHCIPAWLPLCALGKDGNHVLFR